jgi:hypothetical protein
MRYRMDERRVGWLSADALELLVWCADDFTELAGLLGVLHHVRQGSAPDAERDRTLAAIGELLSAGLVRVGDMRSNAAGLAFWTESWTESLARIETIWQVGAIPQVGENPWFYATDKGKRMLTT